MKPLNSSGKRAQVDKDKTLALVAIGIASVVLVAGIMISKSLWSQATYLGKVADKKEQAVDQLNANKDSVETLRDSYEEFVGQNPNLIGGSSEETGGNNGDNAKLVLDALPSEYDFPALVSSVEGLLSSYTINSIEGVDDSLLQQSASGGLVEIPLKMEFTSTYDGHKEAISSLKRSIRPFKITRLELSGTNNKLDTTVEVVTYYQPETGLKVDRRAVQ